MPRSALPQFRPIWFRKQSALVAATLLILGAPALRAQVEPAPTESDSPVSPVDELTVTKAALAAANERLRVLEQSYADLGRRYDALSVKAEKLSDASRDAADARARLADMKAEYRTVQLAGAKAESEAHTAADARDALAAKNADLAAKLQRATADLATARQMLAKTMPETSPVSTPDPELTAARERAVRAETEARDATVAGEKLSTQLAEARAALAESTARAEKLATPVIAAPPPSVEPQMTLDRLTRQSADAQAAAKQAQTEAHEAVAARQKIEAQLKATQAKSASDLVALQAELKDARAAAKVASDQAAAEKTRSTETARLTAENEALRHIRSELEVVNVRLTKEKEVAENALLDARRVTAAAAAPRDPVTPAPWADWTKTLTTIETQITQLGQNSGTAQAAAQAAQTAAEKTQAELAKLQAKVDGADATARTQQTGLSELTALTTKLTTEKTALHAELAAAKTSADRARAERDALQARLTTTETSRSKTGDTKQLTAENAKLQEQIKTLMSQVNALPDDRQRLAAAEAKTTALQAEMAAIKAKQEDASHETETRAADESTAWAKEKAGLQSRVDDLTAKLAAQEKENVRLAQTIVAADKARTDAERSRTEEAGGPTELAVAKRLIENLEAENTRISDTMEALERDRVARIAQLHRENAALQKQSGAIPTVNPGTWSMAGGSAGTPRVHVVNEGDTLTGISLRYYGTANRWQDIYNANRPAIASENLLRVGARLTIP